jgi:hypothetical protein
MIMSNGTFPFGTSSMDGKYLQQRNGAYLTNQLDSWTRARQNQFPTPRIPSQFLTPTHLMVGNNSGGGGGGLQPSLGMLCDVAGAVDLKRPAVSDNNKMLMNPKRFKPMTVAEMNHLHNASKPVPLKDNPILLERISALGGGFPMPKWGRAMGGVGGGSKGKTPAVDATAASTATLERLAKKQGGFPMPSLKGRVTLEPTLSSYKSLWTSTDSDLRREVLSRQLHRGHVKILNGGRST